jgi:hypothetical protein
VSMSSTMTQYINWLLPTGGAHQTGVHRMQECAHFTSLIPTCRQAADGCKKRTNLRTERLNREGGCSNGSDDGGGGGKRGPRHGSKVISTASTSVVVCTPSKQASKQVNTRTNARLGFRIRSCRGLARENGAEMVALGVVRGTG